MILKACRVCGHLSPDPLCPDHRRQSDRDRGSSHARGYGRQHQRRRRDLAPLIATGTVDCARCGEPIRPDEPWDLGHDDRNRDRYSGPEHARCNRATKTWGRPTSPGSPKTAGSG